MGRDRQRNAGDDLIVSAAAKIVNQVGASGATRTTTTLGPIANLNASGEAAIVTGGNLEQDAGKLNLGGNLSMAVGGNYDPERSFPSREALRTEVVYHRP